MSKCKECGADLSADEIAVYKKLIYREADEFLCIPCLARSLKVKEEDIRIKIEQFRKSGCTLFV